MGIIIDHISLSLVIDFRAENCINNFISQAGRETIIFLKNMVREFKKKIVMIYLSLWNLLIIFFYVIQH